MALLACRASTVQRPLVLAGRAAIVAMLLTLLPACSSQRADKLTPPQQLIAPYSTNGSQVIFAVAPPRNESGFSAPDVLAMGDELVAQLEQIRGVRCLPMNRTVDAMRSLKLPNITTSAQAKSLATLLGADAVLVPTITAYDPYIPILGIAAALYARDTLHQAFAATTVDVDPRDLLSRATELDPGVKRGFGNAPVSSVSNLFDGRNHQVQADVMTYAAGRERNLSATGWKRNLQSMPLFVTYCGYRTASDLIQAEWIRLGSVPRTDKADNSREQRNLTRQTVDTKGDTGRQGAQISDSDL